jgi:hypothetical protein
MMSELVGLGDHVSFRVDRTLAEFTMLAHCKGRERAPVTKVQTEAGPRQGTVYKR